MQHGGHYAKAITGHARHDNQQKSQQQTTQSQAQRQTQASTLEQGTEQIQQFQESGCSQTNQHPQDQKGQDVPTCNGLNVRHFVRGVITTQHTHGQVSTDSRHQQGAKAAHGHGAQHNLGHKHGTGDRSAISGSYTGCGTTGHQQAQTGFTKQGETANRGSGQGGQMHHRPFAANRAARGHRHQGRQGSQQPLANGQAAIANGHSFHIVRIASRRQTPCQP